MPRLGGRGNGDLMVEVIVRTPTNLTERGRQLIQELSKEISEDNRPIRLRDYRD